MGDIAYQNKDVTAKVMAEALKGKSLAPFGIHQLKIVDILPTNLPVIESNELRLDNLFLLSDGSIGIMDYESAYNQENFVKYINYIARVIKRYAINHELDRIKQIKMIRYKIFDFTYTAYPARNTCIRSLSSQLASHSLS